MTTEPILDVVKLSTVFHSFEGPVRAVDDVSFSVRPGETLCIVGESGSGKSAAALSLLKLIPAAAGRITAGRVQLSGVGNILDFDEKRMSDIRGARISMIFQEPMTSLNPMMRVGEQIAESILRHESVGRRAAWRRTADLLRQVQLSDPARALRAYPHELSGGMRQRIMIAMAVACRPQLIIADEPTTALDVTTQARILELLASLRHDIGSAVLLITHDLGVVRQMAQAVCVMYAGQIVEKGNVEQVLGRASHPYTQGLLRSVPGGRRYLKGERLPTIGGAVPNLARLPTGCRFQDRCSRVHDRCYREEPQLLPIEDADGETPHLSRCWLTAPGANGNAAS